MRRLRGLLVDKVGVRLDEDTAAKLDDYVSDLQSELGDDVVVGRADAVRIVLRRFLRRRSAQVGQRRGR